MNSVNNQSSLSDIYQQKCKELQLKPNTQILSLLSKTKSSAGAIAFSSLDLSHKNLESKDIIPLAATLCFNGTLRKLNLSNNLIDKRGCKAISSMLRKNTSIEELDLSGNKITDVGIKILSEGLTENSTLRILSLRDNNINDFGVQSLAESLRQANAKNLVGLSLDDNTFDAAGIERLVNLIKVYPSLQMVSINRKEGRSMLAVRFLGSLPPSVQAVFNAKISSAPSTPDLTSQRSKSDLSLDPDIQSHFDEIANSIKRDISLLGNTESPIAQKLSAGLKDISANLKLQMELSAFNTPDRAFHLKMDESSMTEETPPSVRKIRLVKRHSNASTPTSQRSAYSSDVETPSTPQLQVTDLATARKRIQHLEADLKQFKEANIQISKECKELQMKLHKQAEIYQRQIEAFSNMTPPPSEDLVLKSTVLAERARYDTTQKELTEKVKQNLSLQHDMETLRFQKKQASKEMKEKMQQEKKKWQAEYDRLAAEFTEYQEKHKKEFYELYTDFEEARNEIKGLKETNKILEDENDDLRQQLEELRKETSLSNFIEQRMRSEHL